MTISIPTTLISEPFATGDSTKTYPVPVASQIGITAGAASFTDGFPPLTRTALGAGGIPPSGEDMNGILYMVTQLLAWSCSGGFYKYSSTQSTAIGGYPLGAVLQSTDGTNHFWLNTTANNTTNPDSGGSGWVALPFPGITQIAVASGTYNLTSAQSSVPIIELVGTLTGNVVINFPPVGGQEWVVANACVMDGHAVTLQTAAGVSQTTLTAANGYGGAVNVFSDGTYLYCNNVSLSGLAPLASPALTGTPTAPTGGGATTQIANGIFVYAALNAALTAYAALASPAFVGAPTAPTAATGTTNAQLATTAFVVNQVAASAVNSTVAGTQVRRGSFTCVNGTQGVTFSTPFPTACDQVFVQWAYANPDVGYVSGTPTANGFSYTNGNSGLCYYVAYGH